VIRLIAPFRPLPPESKYHLALTSFDWVGALQMLSGSAQRACGVPVQVVTDVDTDLPLPMLRYRTSHRRLMLWTLEACLSYLRSDDFDRDTIMLDVDQLIYRDLSPWFTGADLGVLVRPGKMAHNALLNGVQWWAVAGKARLVAFYQHALTLAEALPEASIVWGADTEAVRELIAPIELGTHQRAGLSVAMIQSTEVLTTFTTTHALMLTQGLLLPPAKAVVDFRGFRKLHMRAFYEATLGQREMVA